MSDIRQIKDFMNRLWNFINLARITSLTKGIFRHIWCVDNFIGQEGFNYSGFRRFCCPQLFYSLRSNRVSKVIF